MEVHAVPEEDGANVGGVIPSVSVVSVGVERWVLFKIHTLLEHSDRASRPIASEQVVGHRRCPTTSISSTHLTVKARSSTV